MAGKKANLDHIRYIPNSGQACCYHCGDFYQITPASMSLMLVIIKQYAKEHRRCKETEQGRRLYESNVQAFEKLPEDRKNHFATLSLPKTSDMGEKIAQHMYMEEMKKADLGDMIAVEIVEEKHKCNKCDRQHPSHHSAWQCCKEHP